ncbi:MAG: glycosyltransferase family 1 protein, partial [Planctomycetes bacterium]|nr:glycosyltransferase family 1 protein [Planctomycetota bacterium]
ETKVRFYLDNPEARNQIITQGKQRVLNQHTYAARVPKILDTLKTRIIERY